MRIFGLIVGFAALLIGGLYACSLEPWHDGPISRIVKAEGFHGNPGEILKSVIPDGMPLSELSAMLSKENYKCEHIKPETKDLSKRFGSPKRYDVECHRFFWGAQASFPCDRGHYLFFDLDHENRVMSDRKAYIADTCP